MGRARSVAAVERVVSPGSALLEYTQSWWMSFV
jgi:hypothetical protein